MNTSSEPIAACVHPHPRTRSAGDPAGSQTVEALYAIADQQG
jgi:hypothetical protein